MQTRMEFEAESRLIVWGIAACNFQHYINNNRQQSMKPPGCPFRLTHSPSPLRSSAGQYFSLSHGDFHPHVNCPQLCARDHPCINISHFEWPEHLFPCAACYWKKLRHCQLGQCFSPRLLTTHVPHDRRQGSTSEANPLWHSPPRFPAFFLLVMHAASHRLAELVDFRSSCENDFVRHNDH